MNESEVVAVEVLWARLRDMENKRRFQGLAYPSGMSVFPFRLGGQGFFPRRLFAWHKQPRIWPDKRFCQATRKSGFTATTPHSFPNSLNATAAVSFLNENGRQVDAS
jgi:hypothetical protein